MSRHNVYRFHAELADFEPKIWRRFEINGEKTMAELGYALMLMFEIQATHLFRFKDNRKDARLWRPARTARRDRVKGLVGQAPELGLS
jgi:hypothetical protein